MVRVTDSSPPARSELLTLRLLVIPSRADSGARHSSTGFLKPRAAMGHVVLEASGKPKDHVSSRSRVLTKPQSHRVSAKVRLLRKKRSNLDP